jgi:PhnB protein
MSIKGSRGPQDRGLAPNLIVRGVAEAITFYEKALGAEVLYRGTMPNGVTLHAQLRVGSSFILLSDESMSQAGGPTGSPEKLGGTSAILEIFVDDVDSAFERALSAGGKPLCPVMDAFYGDRIGTFRDPYGHLWTLATVKEIVTPEELHRRMLEHFSAPEAVS